MSLPLYREVYRRVEFQRQIRTTVPNHEFSRLVSIVFSFRCKLSDINIS